MAVQLIDGAALAAFAPDWKRGIDLALRWRTLVAEGLDGREDRAGLRAAPEATQTWRIAAPIDEAERARREETLRAALDAGRAAAPCFARPCYVAEISEDGLTLTLQPTRWPWTADGWLFVFGADDQPQISQIQAVAPDADSGGVRLGLSAALPTTPIVGAALYPVLFGRLEISPGQGAAEVCRLRVPAWRIPAAFAEWEYYLGAPIPPEPLARAATETANWNQPPPGDDQGAAARLGFTLNAPLADEDELAEAEAFFAALDGGRLPFWLPERDPAASIAAGADNAPGDARSRFLVKAQAQALAPGVFLWFTHPIKPTMAARVASVDNGPDAQTALVTLDAPLVNAPDADWDVFRLRLARLGGDALQITRWADDRATLRLEALEILPPQDAPDEDAPPPPRLAYLYRFQNRREAAAVWRLTGGAQALTLAGETFLPALISHRALAPSGGATMEEQGVAVEWAAAPGELPPWQFLTEPTEGTLTLTVQRLDLAAPDPATTAQPVFQGQVARARFIGAGRLAAEARPSAGWLDGTATGFFIGAPCNHLFCGPGCGLAEAAWTVVGALGSVNGARVTLAVDPGKPPGWFAGGRLIAGAGANAETRTILASEGAELWLNAPLRRTAPGAALQARAGCSHLPEDCQGRFGNYANYGGHPLVMAAGAEPTIF